MKNVTIVTTIFSKIYDTIKIIVGDDLPTIFSLLLNPATTEAGKKKKMKMKPQ